MVVAPPPAVVAAAAVTLFPGANAKSMTRSTISANAWQKRALLAELFHGPEAETDGPLAGKDGAELGTRPDHGDDVVAADVARQSATARGDAALQAHRGTFLGGIWPRRQSRPEPADERRSARRGCWPRQGADQPRARRPRVAQAGRQGGQSPG